MKRLLALALAPALMLSLGCESNKSTTDEPAPPPETSGQMSDDSVEVIETTYTDPEPAPQTTTDVIYVEPEPATNYQQQQPAAQSTPDYNTTPAPAAGGQTYTVQKGDTLWSIAKSYYGDGQKWRDIVNANPGLNPKKLRVGQQITLP